MLLLALCFVFASCATPASRSQRNEGKSKRTARQEKALREREQAKRERDEASSSRRQRQTTTRPTTPIAAPVAPAPASSRQKLEGKDIFAKYNNAVFTIYGEDAENIYQGSGFFIGLDGLAVSNYHVFDGPTVMMVKLSNSSEYNIARIHSYNEEEDFILFTVNCENSCFIPIAESKPLVGEKVYAIGSPLGLENTFSSGEVSQWRDDHLMQTTVPIDHGSSGGALINEYGEVVGITSGTLNKHSNANLNYAWSIEAIKPYLK